MNVNSIDGMNKNPRSAMQTAKEALESELSLRLLSTIEDDKSVTQRSLALRLGIAVGLTNAYFKRCVRKGWIKMQAVPAKRYAYYLTPKGFAEKSRLVGEYLTSSLGFFRRARSEMADCMAYSHRRGWRRLALVGAGDLAEIATLAAIELPIDLALVIAPRYNGATTAGLPVTTNLDRAQDFDAVLLTDITAPQETYEALRRYLPDDRILAPELLRVTRRTGEAGT
jgi:DNA-binding MarR family transcriptional regulator